MASSATPSYFTALRVVFLALLMGMCLFCLVAFFIVSNQGPLMPDLLNQKNFLLVLASAVALAAVVGANAFYRSRLRQLVASGDIKTILAGYRSAFVVRCALYELPVFLAIILYLMTGIWFFLAIAGIVVALFVMNFPSSEKAKSDLNLDPSLAMHLDGPDAEMN